MSQPSLRRTAQMFLAWETILCLLVDQLGNSTLIAQILEQEADARKTTGVSQHENVWLLRRIAYRLSHQHKAHGGSRSTDLKELLRSLEDQEDIE